MATANLGHGSAMGVGAETTYGTAVARAFWLRIVSWGLKRTIEKVPRPHLGTNGATSTNRRQHYTSNDDAGGPVEALMAYDDATLVMLAHGMGAVATTGTGPYVHTFTLLKFPYTVDTDKIALTLEGLLGDGDAEVFEGCLIARTEISISEGSVMSATYEIIAETSGGLVSQGTPTFSSNGEEILFSHGGQLTFNGSSDDIRELTITIDQKLARRKFIGSALTKHPQMTDNIEVSVRFVREYVNSTRNAEYIADTQGDATITFTGTGNNALTITMQNLYISDVSRTVSQAGVITETVDAMCESDGTDEGLKLAFTNDNASAFTN